MAESLAESRCRCLKQIKALDLPDPVSVEAICERVADLRGRPVRILRHQMPWDSPCGLRIATRDADYLIVQEGATPAHQDLILLHELGHVLFDPAEAGPLDEDLLQVLAPLIAPATVVLMLGRSRFSLPSEQAAEVFATLLLARTSRWTPELPRVVAAGANDFVARLEQTLE